MFFFFQAEDGIRDLIVTGVQTCALPIFPSAGILSRNEFPSPRIASSHARSRDAVRGAWGPSERRRRFLHHQRLYGDAWVRSEERRVGKECRAGWGREGEKRKK